MLHRLPDLLPGSGIHKISSGLIGTKFQITAHGHIEHIHHRRFDIGQSVKIHNRHVICVIYILLGVCGPERDPSVSMFTLLAKQPF